MFLYFSLFLALFQISTSRKDHIHRIAFGSCYNPNKGDEIWKLIQSFSPNQVILLGDQFYADFDPVYEFYMYANGSNPDIIREEYDRLYSQRGFNDLLTSLSHGWISTYDDHDYGKNNGDRTYKFRDEAIALFAQYNARFHYVDFITLPDTFSGEMRTEKKTGVFSSHTYSFPIQQGTVTSSFKYKVILLDTRSNKDPKGTESGDFLGEQQWRWLQYELSEQALVDVDLVLLGSGIQILPDDKLVEESWSEFPQQRERLLTLLSKVALTNNVLMLSGDIHSAEISQMTCSYQGVAERTWKEERRLAELTSSGLSHSVTQLMDLHRMASEKLERNDSINGGVVKPRIMTKTRSVFVELFIAMYQFFYPAVYRENKYYHIFHGLHFGLIDFLIDVDGGKLNTLRFQTITHEGSVAMSFDLPLRPRQASRMLIEGDGGTITCTPIQGTLSSLESRWYKTELLLSVIVVIWLPSLAFLYFVGRAICYLCFGKGMGRKDTIEQHEKKKKQ